MGERWVLAAPGSLLAGSELDLDPPEARHVTRVLRRGPGSQLVVTDGRGAVAEAEIIRAGKDRVTVKIERVVHHPRPPLNLTVALGLLHSQAMDWAVQKAVESGASRFIPLVTARSQLGEATARRRLAHWRRVARQALKQCHRPWDMEISGPLGFDELTATVPEGAGVVADRSGAPPWEIGIVPRTVLLVGPEGGLTGDERSRLDAVGWRRVRLASHVLRAETAVAVGTAILVLGAAREIGQ